MEVEVGALVVLAVVDDERGLRVFFSFTSTAVECCCCVVAVSLLLRGFLAAGVVDEDLLLALVVAERDLSPPSVLMASWFARLGYEMGVLAAS